MHSLVTNNGKTSSSNLWSFARCVDAVTRASTADVHFDNSQSATEHEHPSKQPAVDFLGQNRYSQRKTRPPAKRGGRLRIARPESAFASPPFHPDEELSPTQPPAFCRVRAFINGVVLVLIAASIGMLPAQAAESAAGSSGTWTRSGIAAAFVERQEGLWRQIAQGDPPPATGSRVLFAYAMALCESGRHAERLERLFDLLAQMQDCDPASDAYGNLWWTWRHGQVTDRNAVEFCAQDAIVIRLRHARFVPGSAMAKLDAMLKRMGEGCRRHRVPVNYTNIAILNAANLIVLGEMLDDRSLRDEGLLRLKGICLWTWQFGTAEYVSPTYYAPDLNGLMSIRQFARSEEAQSQAAALFELLWTDIALNWFAPGERLGGAHSRSYDYLRGQGAVDGHLILQGWLAPGDTDGFELLHSAMYDFRPPDRIRQWNRQMPRVVRQRWGINYAESRTHAVYSDITLSTSGAGYPAARQDMPLTVDLPGSRRLPRCYFIADGRQDPYGTWRYPTGGAAGHMKALHLTPFWAAAQADRDALAVAVYREKDLSDEETFNVQSHFVYRKPSDGLWIGPRRVDLPTGVPDEPATAAVELGEAVIARWGTAALALRVIAANRQDGLPATIRVIDDGNRFGVLRLTINHRAATKTTDPHVALWVRIGTGLSDDAALAAWRTRFETDQAHFSADDSRIVCRAAGETGPVAVNIEKPCGRGGSIELTPPPCPGILELDGCEIGRPLLASIEPIRNFKGPTLDSPALLDKEGLALPAANCLVLPGMMVVDSAEDGAYVVQPKDPPRGRGMIVVPLRVKQAGRYLLSAKVRAPNAQSDSLYVNISGRGFQLPQADWLFRVNPSWQRQTAGLGRANEPSPLSLPAGDCLLILQTRETDLAIQTIYLSPQ